MIKKSKNMHKIFILFLFLAISSFKGYGQDLQISISNVTCYGLSNGIVNVNLISQVNCGPGPYQYQIVGPSPSLNTVTSAVTSSTSYTFTNLAAGTYNITILVNGLACNSTTQSVIQPLALVATPTINLNSATITVNGGSTGGCANPCRGYNVLWSGGNPPMSGGSLNACPPEIITCSQNSINNTYSMTNLSPGTYTITIEDYNNCLVTSSFIMPPIPLTVSYTQVNILCYGSATGSIDLTVSGSAAPYTYLWSTGQTTEDLTNLQAGTYSVTVTDANGGTATIIATIAQPPQMLLVENHVNNFCYSGSTGSIDLTVIGGTPGYMYLWSNGQMTQDINNLPNGVYSVVVTDANNCQTSFAPIITSPPALTLTSITSINNIDITVSGGTAPYTYLWSNGSTTQDLSNLSPGAYTVMVADANGCTVTQTYTIQNQTPPLVVSLSTTNICCLGLNQGTITIIASGGNPPYNVSWAGVSPAGNEILASGGSYTILNIMAGSYTVVVTDAIGNSNSTVVTITQPLPFTLSATQINPLCPGVLSGSVNLTVGGGIAPYSYLWMGPGGFTASTQNINNLSPGVYTVAVDDACGCTLVLSIVITTPPALTLTGIVTNIACAGINSGSIDATVSGGTPGYSYAWTGPSSYTNTTQDISTLGPGTFNLTVTDANLCTITDNWTINPGPQALQLSQTNVDILCAGQSTGSIDLSVIGGTPLAGGIYNYSWTGPAGYSSSLQDISVLSNGNYSVIVTDANNCTASLTNIDITSPSAFTASGIIVNNNIDLSVGGGTPPYNYSWSNGAVTQDLPNVPPGTYIVIVTDAYNCMVSDTFVVNNASIDGNELSEIMLFPNPAMDKLTIRGGAGSLANHSFVVQDCYGRIVEVGSFESDEATVLVEHLAPGLYHLHVGLNTISFVVIH